MLEFALELQHQYEESVSADHRKERAQIFTPPEVARFMAGMFSPIPAEYVLLDPGAGVGTLTAAFCERVLKLHSPRKIAVHLFEDDPALNALLRRNLDNCRRRLAEAGHAFDYVFHPDDFIASAAYRIPGKGLCMPSPRSTRSTASSVATFC